MLRKHVAGREQVGFLKGVAGRDEDALPWNLVTYGYDGLEKRLVHIVSEAAHLAGRGHVHSEERISLLEAREGELGGLDAHVSEPASVDVHRLGMLPQHHLRGEFYEINLQNLGHEGEASGGPQVALDDTDMVVVGQELDIERARDV